MTPRRAARAAFFAAFVGATAALAEPTDAPPQPPPGVTIDVDAALTTSPDTLIDGWNDIVVRITNGASEPLLGRVVVKSRPGYSETVDYDATAPFELGPGGKTTLQIPVIAKSYNEALASVFIAGRERAVAERRFTVQPPQNAVLLDVRESSLLRPLLNETPISALSFATRSPGTATPSPLLILAGPRLDATTGDPILPARAGSYGATSVVLLSTGALARLDAAETDALATWILGGGTAALTVTRPEDLASPTLVTMLGGAAHPTAVPRSVYRELTLPSMIGGSSGPRFAAAPSDALAPTLLGYEGGNLTPSLYGSSAAYGLGEVHLLPFDPGRKPALDDPWAQARLVDLARRAFDRQHSVVRMGDASSYQANDVRRQLDPNENSRWGIGAAALLLCAYAALAGPVNFSRAARSGKPLRALLWLPVLALGAFLLVVGVGTLAKGTSGRARHLTLVQAGAGVGAGHAARFRGFYTAEAEELSIAATDARCSLTLGASPSFGEVTTHVAVQKDGLRIAGVATLPWQTLIVAEEGIAELGRGLAIVRDRDGATVLVNRTGRTLRSVILRPASGPARYFPSIADGERHREDEGRLLDATENERDFSASLVEPSPLYVTPQILPAYAMSSFVDDDTPGLGSAWAAIVSMSTADIDWFPGDVPVVLAQVEGGEGRTEDAGLDLESDRVLLRVVGYGGAP